MIIFNVHVLRFAHELFNVDFLLFLHKVVDFFVLKCFISYSVDLLEVIDNSMTKIRGVYPLCFGGKLSPSHCESHIELASYQLGSYR